MVCFVLFDLCVKCFRFIQESKVGVDLLEIEFLGVNKKICEKHYLFKKKIKEKGSHGLNLMFNEFNVIFRD